MPGYKELDGLNDSLAQSIIDALPILSSLISMAPPGSAAAASAASEPLPAECSGRSTDTDIKLTIPDTCVAIGEEESMLHCGVIDVDELVCEQVSTLFRQLFVVVGLVHVRRLMRLRHTVGTQPHLLPPRLERMLECYNQPFTPGIALSVGARARSKHAHRDTAGFWGKIKGGAADLNASALEAIMRLLRNVIWINVHTLPHEEFVLEVREPAGYGARWLADGSKFRGFLEPYMEGGHTVGWKH